MTEFDAADLPDLVAWQAAYAPPPDTTAFLAKHLSVASAVLFAELMAPKFVVVGDCVILASRYTPGNFTEWRRAMGANSAAIESALNHLHLWEIFEPKNAIEEQAIEHLARMIADNWLLNAQRCFPDRRFVVDVTDDYGPTVTLQTRIEGQA